MRETRDTMSTTPEKPVSEVDVSGGVIGGRRLERRPEPGRRDVPERRQGAEPQRAGTPDTQRAGTPDAGSHELLAHDATDTLARRLQHAVSEFIDEPRDAVAEADMVLGELAEQVTEAVEQRRRSLRTSWQASTDDTADTEQLRLALRDYREMTQRLLRI